MIRILSTILLGVLPFLLFAQGAITGQITDEKGEALPGASVYLVEADMLTVSNEGGVYLFEELEPGTYTVRVTFVGYETRERTTRVQSGIGKNLVHIQLTERIVNIRPAVIYATRVGKKAPFAYSNIDREELQRENLGQDVPYLLRRTASTVVTSDAGTGIGYTGIRIRGTDPTRVNVTINGIPLNDAESQNVFWVDLPDFASSTEDVQIQRGVGTSTNGAAAFGASINLNTNQMRPEPYLTLDGSGGSFNTLRGSLRFGTGDLGNGFSLDGRLSRTVSDGYVDRASADLTSWYVSGAWLGEDHWVRINAFSGHERTYQAWYGIPRDSLDNRESRTYNPAGTEKPGEPYEDQVDDYTQTHLQAFYGWTINRNLDLSAALHYTRGSGYFEEYKADEALLDYGLLALPSDTLLPTNSDLVRRRWLDNHFYGGIFSLNYISNSNRYRMTLGGGANEYLGDHFGEVIWAQYFGNGEPEQRYYENDATKRDYNIYLKQSKRLGQSLDLFLDLQLRRVDYTYQGLNNDRRLLSGDHSFTFFNPKAGLSYTLSDKGLLFGSVAVANREPNRDDFVDAAPNSLPRPETLYDVEIGYRKEWENARLELVGYYMYYRDQLVLTGQINDVGAYTRTNVPESYRRGVEIIGGIRPLKWLQVNGNLTLSQNRILNFTEYLDSYDPEFTWLGQETIDQGETELSFSPSVIGALDLTWMPLAKQTDDLQIRLLNKYVGEQYVDNSGAETSLLDAYLVSDLQLSYEWEPQGAMKKIVLTFMVRNLFDELYASNGWSYRYVLDGSVTQDRGFYPQAGRHYFAGFRLMF